MLLVLKNRAQNVCLDNEICDSISFDDILDSLSFSDILSETGCHCIMSLLTETGLHIVSHTSSTDNTCFG